MNCSASDGDIKDMADYAVLLVISQLLGAENFFS
jgi:hypothetical protein